MQITDFDAFKRDVIGTYNRAAHLYDQVGTKLFTHYACLLADALESPANASILDIACGRGAILFALSQKLGQSGKAYGLDLAEEMIIHTHREIMERAYTQTSVLVMDGDYLAFAPQSFDCVTCGAALFFMDYEQVLKRIYHLLKAEGQIAITIPQVPDDKAEFERWKWLFKLTKESFPADFQAPASWVAPRRLSQADILESALAKAGFVDIRHQQEVADLYFKDEEDWWQWEWSQGSRFWVEAMTEENLANFKRESFKHLAQMKEEQGIRMRDGMRFTFARKN